MGENNLITIDKTQVSLETRADFKPNPGMKYKETFVKLLGSGSIPSQPLEASNNDLAAISYRSKSPKQNDSYLTRLYYVDKAGILQEIGRDGTQKDWFRGSLGQNRIKAAQNTSLTAHLRQLQDTQYLKVYLYADVNGAARLTVAWHAVGAQIPLGVARDPVIRVVQV